ncbi:ABC transporter permease [Paenibacillus eucommiae]|uniref:Aldouronate transport system permease protein n=1 Tax=Paenibacillus eucommiae TaxID=1355755 RepID=A0ABS4ISY3_9BACL|nr:ABC transporter permease subunit [Paenibacillus eucommiae]MBP1990235.1 putative aldouronate transport system permease protein [Paenibacillus eucommiae]
MRSRLFWNKFYTQRYLFLMLAPAFILVLIFSYLPLAGWMIAFRDYQVGQSLWKADWIGLMHFKRFFLESNDYIYLIRNTLVMNIMSLTLCLFSGCCFAILINEIRSRFFMRIIQTITFFPFFISWVIIYSIVNSLFGVTTGVVNELLLSWGFIQEGINLLGDKAYSWTLIVVMDVWKSLGYNSILFIAAIAGIPPELYEAAEIDGAKRIAKIWYVTVPHLVPTLIVLLILNSGWIINSNIEQFFLFTNGSNWEKMEVLDMYIYKFGMKLLDFPYSTAVSIIKTFVSLVILLSVNQISKRATGSSIF